LPLIQIQYTRQNQFLNYKPLLGHPRWMVDKTTALELMFLGIRARHYNFPPMSEFKTYAEDLLSPYETVSELAGSDVRRFVRNPASPDDFAHALCFATLAAMRMCGCSIMDLASGLVTESLQGVPDPASIDPREMLKANS
jgi:hypothetical protein